MNSRREFSLLVPNIFFQDWQKGNRVMLHAVALGKAKSFFAKKKARDFGSVRRPQEDMVTSAVFGSIKLLPASERRTALEHILGEAPLQEFFADGGDDVLIDFWPRFPGTHGRTSVEPDILLHSGHCTVIVEVKWHAPLPDDQLEQEINAVSTTHTGGAKRKVMSLVLLGEGSVPIEAKQTVPQHKRTWRDVSAALANLRWKSPSLGTWAGMIGDFLQETDLGHTFNGFDGSTLATVHKSHFQFGQDSRKLWSADINRTHISSYKFVKGNSSHA